MGEHPKEYPKVFQLYLWKDKGLNRALLQKAREHGYDAVALTADFTWFGNRERDTRNGFSVPPNYSVRQIVEAIKRPPKAPAPRHKFWRPLLPLPGPSGRSRAVDSGSPGAPYSGQNKKI